MEVSSDIQSITVRKCIYQMLQILSVYMALEL